MKAENRIVKTLAAFGLICSLSLVTHAQVGSGWSPGGETIQSQQTSSGCTITPISGGYEFHSAAKGRAENRWSGADLTTTWQWDGTCNIKVWPSGSSNTCIYQLWGSPSGDVIIDMTAGGGSTTNLMSLHDSDKVVAPGVPVGTPFNYAANYDPSNGVETICINGSQTGTTKLIDSPPGHYDKNGSYVSDSGTGNDTVDWTNTTNWKGGSLSGGGGTVATPTFSPGGGTYTSAQNVSLSDSTGGSTIHYTTDGSTPTSSSPVYSSPIPVSSGTVTIKAIGTESGFTNSNVGSATYTISSGGTTVATPTFSPGAGTYTSAQNVSISDSTSGATIYYTTDGSTPTTSSTVYSSPIPVSSGTVTINAIGAKSGDNNSSVGSATYTISSGGGGCETSGSSWSSYATGTVSGTFTATFSVTPGASGCTAYIGMTNGAQYNKDTSPWLVKLHSTGDFEALNGSSYSSTNTINWVAGSTYQFSVVCNLTTGTYSVYVTPPGGSQQTLASNFAVQSGSATTLNNWGMQDSSSSLEVCNFSD